LLGHLGFARELAAVYDIPLNVPSEWVDLMDSGAEYPVKINTDKARRFTACHIKNITVKPSDAALLKTLEDINHMLYNALVDITNRVQAYFGQPMHVFDAAKIAGGLQVRMASEGEVFMGLDGHEYTLTTEDMVIADDEKALSLAGIMGGMASGVSKNTTEIVFEAANFDPVTVRKTATRLGIRTDAVMRFEKSLDPEQCKKALNAAVKYCIDIYPEAEIIATADVYPTIFPELKIQLNPDTVRHMSGVDISNDEIIRILTALDFVVDENFMVTVPSNRATKDIESEIDLVEEVLRIHGYDHLQSDFPTFSCVPTAPNMMRNMQHKIRDLLSNVGLTEVKMHSLVSHKTPHYTEDLEYIELENPLSKEQSLLRKSLAPHIVKDVKHELRTHGLIKYFELGRVHFAIEKEKEHLVIVIGEMGNNKEKLLNELKEIVTNMLHSIGLRGISFTPKTDVSPLSHPHMTANIVSQSGQILGEITTLHPNKNNTQGSSIAFTELDAEIIHNELQTVQKKFIAPSEFPPIMRDISIIVPEKTHAANIEQIMQQAAPVLSSAILFDEYKDTEKIGEGKKNLAYKLKFQSHTRTLDMNEVQLAFDAIVRTLGEYFDAELRDK